MTQPASQPTPRAPFAPDPAQTDALISAIASDFTSSLAGLADEYNTTLESLTLWMTRPDIAERLDALQSACAARVRLVASNFLPLAVETLRSVLADFRDIHCNALCDNSSPRAMATRARAAENARRAASTLLRLAHYSPRGWRTPPDRRSIQAQPREAPHHEVLPPKVAPSEVAPRDVASSQVAPSEVAPPQAALSGVAPLWGAVHSPPGSVAATPRAPPRHVT